jgi:cysteine desulfurase
MTNKCVYLDNAATTQVDPRVVEVMSPLFTERYGNPSSLHVYGREAKSAIDGARADVADLLDAHPSEIIFTSGGTEADNQAVLLAAHAGLDGDRKNIVTSLAEHHAVLKACELLEQQGYEVIRLPVQRDATVRIEDVESVVDDKTLLVTLMHVNNETGGRNDIESIGACAARYGALFHCDAVQSFGKSFFSTKRFQTDLVSVSSHKLHGPKGVGALFIRKGLKFPSLFHGGSQEFGRRGGTENVPGIAGFGEAARLANLEHQERNERWLQFRSILTDRLSAALPEIIVNGSEAAQANILSISFPSRIFTLDSDILMMSLDINGLAVSSGSACMSGAVQASHVMNAIGHDAQTGASTIRFSFGAFTTENDVLAGAEIAIRTLQALLGRSAS